MRISSVLSLSATPPRGGSPAEDGLAVNFRANMFIVTDGVSAPYCPNVPQVLRKGKSGGQLVSQIACAEVHFAAPSDLLENVLERANKKVGRKQDFNCSKQAVAGACFAACHVNALAQEVVLITAGDCFNLRKDGDGWHFSSNFDQAAFEFEKKGDEFFQECRDKAAGDIGKAWNLYYEFFSEKQFFRANRNVGRGGHGMLNGDMNLSQCWKLEKIPLSGDLRHIILGTDGALPQSETDPQKREELEDYLGSLYEWDGLNEMLEWRKEFPLPPHIKGLPEATLIGINLERDWSDKIKRLVG